jgi:hypothetical protein
MLQCRITVRLSIANTTAVYLIFIRATIFQKVILSYFCEPSWRRIDLPSMATVSDRAAKAKTQRALRCKEGRKEGVLRRFEEDQTGMVRIETSDIFYSLYSLAFGELVTPSHLRLT